MDQKSLKWAEQLHAELVARIEDLSAALAEVEPLRQELVRLRGQVRGVERLIALHNQYRGQPKPFRVGDAVTPGENAGQPGSSILPAAQSNGITENVADIPSLAFHEPTLGYAGREMLRAIALYRNIAARFFLTARLRLTKQFPRRSA